MKTPVYIKSCDKFFRIVFIAKSVQEANEYTNITCGCAVIAEENGLIFIAEVKETVFKS